MRIFTGKKWKEGFLDYHRNPSEYRIQVLAWKNLERLENVYHTRPKSLRLLINYFPVVGPEGLWTKVWSRLREENRNKKYISCGIGRIMEVAKDGNFKEGDIVAFIAPLHPPLVERITLPQELIFETNKSDIPEVPEDTLLYLPAENKPEKKWWKNIRGWSIYSGIEVTEELQTSLKSGLEKKFGKINWEKAEKFNAANPSSVSEKKGNVKKKSSKKKSGIVFGFGNYAKINIIPYAGKFVNINTIHEIDPTEISFERRIEKWDTAPFPRQDEKYDVYFVASYNHTHVPITLHALNQGAYALVEKPIVNDYDELEDMKNALEKAGRKVFIGFHKRYGTFNKMALKDLGVEYGEPISYHSVVYELEQPEFFWYNWPVSRTTFFANGCHQVDHFLHLNNYSKPINYDIIFMQDKSVLVWIELENGATFTTVFSEKGSLRVGPRDYVELKVPGRDVRIIDNIKYMSETNKNIIRKIRVFKTHSYKTMYQEIGKKIANDEEGDSVESIMTSLKLMLDLETRLQELKGWGNRYEKGKERFWNYFRSE